MIVSRGTRAANARSLFVAFFLAGWIPGWLTWAEEVQAPQFLLGADVSALSSGGRGGGRRGPLPNYQEHGKTNEEWRILLDHGWNVFRLRVFVSPVRNDSPKNSLENMLPLFQRIKGSGAKILLCLHLSDGWADPQHQLTPPAWTNLDLAGLEKAVESHTHDVVKRFKEAGAMPDWVQVGNEITRGTLWPAAQLPVSGSAQEAEQWKRLTGILKAGIRGVRTAAGDTPPRIAIHIDKGGNWKATEWFFDHLNAAQVDYDIIAQSFYPEWNHGTLEQLWDNMNRCARKYHKDFAVVETGYGRSHVTNNSSMLWPETPEGRLQFMADIVNTVKRAPRGVAVMYWAPEREAWNEDGSPGPAVFVLDQLASLTNRPASHAPAAAFP